MFVIKAVEHVFTRSRFATLFHLRVLFEIVEVERLLFGHGFFSTPLILSSHSRRVFIALSLFCILSIFWIASIFFEFFTCGPQILLLDPAAWFEKLLLCVVTNDVSTDKQLGTTGTAIRGIGGIDGLNNTWPTPTSQFKSNVCWGARSFCHTRLLVIWIFGIWFKVLWKCWSSKLPSSFRERSRDLRDISFCRLSYISPIICKQIRGIYISIYFLGTSITKLCVQLWISYCLERKQ